MAHVPSRELGWSHRVASLFQGPHHPVCSNLHTFRSPAWFLETCVCTTSSSNQSLLILTHKALCLSFLVSIAVLSDQLEAPGKLSWLFPQIQVVHFGASALLIWPLLSFPLYPLVALLFILQCLASHDPPAELITACTVVPYYFNSYLSNTFHVVS